MFIDRQFPAQRIEAVGRGKRELAVPTADEVNEPLNRRVTIEVR
jgi:outer membrane protein OmpA-like peptidoglycan-associated protein